MRMWICLAVAAGACALTAAGCQEKQKPKAPKASVTVARVARRDVPVSVSSTGTVEAIASATVAARVSGVVTRVAFTEGADVRAGDVLFTLDARPFQAAYEQASATWAKDRAQAALARAQAERAEATQSLTAPADLDQARATAAMWSAAARADSAAAHAAKLTLDFATVRAPIAGRASEARVHEGDYVQAGGAAPLVSINRIAPIRVRFTVPASALPHILRYRHEMPRVWVTIPGDTTRFAGTLTFVDNAVDETSGTVLLKGEFANTGGALIPGQFVDVRLDLTVERQATVVPLVAVSNGQSGTFVYVLQPDSTVTPRPVVVTRTVDSLAVLADGLHEGDTVITDGQMRLAPGAKVAVRVPSAGTGGKDGRRGAPAHGR